MISLVIHVIIVLIIYNFNNDKRKSNGFEKKMRHQLRLTKVMVSRKNENWIEVNFREEIRIRKR